MSIRAYIFTMLTSLVLIIAMIFTYQSGRLFVSTFEDTVAELMLHIGYIYPDNGKDEQQVLSFHVTTNWKKVPAPVRQRFPEIPTEVNKHHSIFEEWIFIEPPKRAYSLMVVEHDGKQVYVSRYSENLQDRIDKMHERFGISIDPMLMILLMGLSGLALFVVALLSVFKRIAVPMESLQLWAKKMTMNDLDQPVPDFKFNELNGLATLIHNNMVSMAESVKREQRFLSYASHELRTPIAVLRSNSALLEKINPSPSEKERMVRDRIARASLTMKSMTETLLWLSREGEIDMPVEKVALGELVNSLQQELRYLLAGKNVDVEVSVEDEFFDLSRTPTVIVLNNLIRNAFQHTQQGKVSIRQKGAEIVIVNTHSAQNELVSSNEELGFGLGMQLVEKLTAQFGWRYQAAETREGYTVSVLFS